MADDNLNNLLGTVVLGAVAIKILDSDKPKTVTKTKTVYVKNGKTVKTVTKKSNGNNNHGPFHLNVPRLF